MTLRGGRAPASAGPPPNASRLQMPTEAGAWPFLLCLLPPAEAPEKGRLVGSSWEGPTGKTRHRGGIWQGLSESSWTRVDRKVTPSQKGPVLPGMGTAHGHTPE